MEYVLKWAITLKHKRLILAFQLFKSPIQFNERGTQAAFDIALALFLYYQWLCEAIMSFTLQENSFGKFVFFAIGSCRVWSGM